MKKDYSFKELYSIQKSKPTPAQCFINDVAALTNRSATTVRMWISGVQVPDTKTMKILSDKFGIKPDVLFPNAFDYDK